MYPSSNFIMFLCYNDENFGERRTVYCPLRSQCKKRRTSFLLVSAKCTIPGCEETGKIRSLPTTSFTVTELTQNAFLNGVLDACLQVFSLSYLLLRKKTEEAAARGVPRKYSF